VAFDGTNYLIVWEDYRDGTDTSDVFCARVTQSGTLLDPVGISVCAAPGGQVRPAVSYGGTNYLVVWQDQRFGGADIFGARVAKSGAVLDTNGIPISTAADEQLSPAVAYDGTNYFAVWQDRRSGPYDVYGARVSQTGIILDPSGVPISTARNYQCTPAVHFADSSYLVVWEDSRSGLYDIYGTRVTRAGTVLDTLGIPISTADGHQAMPSVSFGGADFLVLWSDERLGASDVYGARVSPAGILLDPVGFGISTATNIQWKPSAAFDGNNFLVVWDDLRGGASQTYGARVTPAATVLDTSGIKISNEIYSEGHPGVAFGGATSLVVWTNSLTPMSDICGARVSRAGVVLEPNGLLFSTIMYEQSAAATCFDGENFLVVWSDERKDSGDIYGARVTPAGVVLDPVDVPISTAVDDQAFPAVASDGTNSLVVWQGHQGSSYSIYGARVTQGGTVLDSAGILISGALDDQLYVSVAFDGTNYFAVWEDWRSGNYSDIRGARVTPQGSVLDPNAFVISSVATRHGTPSVTFGDSNYLVVWQDNRSGPFNIYGARVTPQGLVLNPGGFAVSTAADTQQNTSLSFDGTNYLAVWEDKRGGGYDVYGARVTQAGAVLDPDGIAIVTAVGTQRDPVAGFDGRNYIVFWRDDALEPESSDIRGAWVSPSGVVLDSCGSIVQPGRQCAPALCRGQANQILVAYDGWTGDVQGKRYDSQRIWGRLDQTVGQAEPVVFAGADWRPRSTILRDVLRTPVRSRDLVYGLYDATGREVQRLRPGPNDVRRLSPGIYFVRQLADEQTEVSKVVITR